MFSFLKAPSMSRKSRFRAAGKNHVWFALFVIAAVVIVSLLANADQTHAPKWPGPIPASALTQPSAQE